MNTITITGRLTAEPELHKTQNGVSVCSFALAVKRPRVKDTVDFINCVVWRQGAEFLTGYGHKGDLIGVVGSLQTRNYEDKEGRKRVSYDVYCDLVEILHSRNGQQATRAPQSAPSNGGYNANQNSNGGVYGEMSGYTDAYAVMQEVDEDLPFM